MTISATSRATVLLVDDEPEIRATLAVILSYSGYHVVTAGTAEEAMATMDSGVGDRVDVIVTDIVLPQRSGVDLLAHARACRPDVEVILMSGAPTLETASEAVRLGANDYLFKPITGRALAGVLEAALERRAQRKRERADAASQAASIARLREDVAARSEELKQSAERYHQLVDELEVAVFELHVPTRTLTHVAGRLVRRIGGEGDPDADCGLDERIHPDDRGIYRRFLDAIDAGENPLAPFELRFRDAGGSTIWTRCIPSARSSGEASRVSGILIDITERKRAEEQHAALEAALARAREELDRRLLAKLALEPERASVRIKTSASDADPNEKVVFGTSVAMADVRRLAELAAEHREPVLIMGETGTGKGALAEWIHRRSPLARAPFVALNCATLRGDLLASELFGHARGAFTSAVAARRGLVEEASGGTLFLDEIGAMALDVQGQLLKVLEEKTFRRLGESKVQRSEFRLICATNLALHDAAERGTFRADLLYRIEVLPIVLPPLRGRIGDLGQLAHALVQASGAGELAIPEATIRYLEGHSWPGNVRELRNALVRAALLSRGRPLLPEHFEGFLARPRPEPPRNAGFPVETPPADAANERERILELLRRFDGNRAKAARELGIGRSSLYRRLREYGIE